MNFAAIEGVEGIRHAIIHGYFDEEKLKKGEILDIGCGTKNYRPPQLCRGLYQSGYRVHGIDIDEALLTEDFPSSIVDITVSGEIRNLGKGRFFLVHESDLTGPFNPDPGLRNYVGTEEWQSFLSRFQSDVAYILSIGGFYIQTGWNVAVYQKGNDGLLNKV